MASTREWDDIIPYLRTLIIEITGEDLPIAVTEINSHWSNAVGGEATPDSFMNAIWWADVLGRMIKNQVSIVNYFSLQSHPSIGGYGLFSRSDRRPTYYVYQIYQEFGGTLVFAGCADESLGIYAATDQAGDLTVILVNLGAEDLRLPLMINGEARRLVKAVRFDQADLLYEMRLSTDDIETQIHIPGYTITLLKFE